MVRAHCAHLLPSARASSGNKYPGEREGLAPRLPGMILERGPNRAPDMQVLPHRRIALGPGTDAAAPGMLYNAWIAASVIALEEYADPAIPV